MLLSPFLIGLYLNQPKKQENHFKDLQKNIEQQGGIPFYTYIFTLKIPPVNMYIF